MLTAFVGATVLDGRNPMSIIPNAVVLVRDGKIQSIRQDGTVPSDAKVVPCKENS